MEKHRVAQARDLPPGRRKVVEVNGTSIGVFNVHGQFYALRNNCPHQGAPLCLGRVVGQTVADRPFEVRYEREGEILKCPWHGWEFDIINGQSIFNPHKLKVRTYDVTVEGPEDEPEDPSIETFPVTLEAGIVFVHV